MKHRYIETKHHYATVAYKQETASDRDLSMHENMIHDLYNEKLELEKQNEEYRYLLVQAYQELNSFKVLKNSSYSDIPDHQKPVYDILVKKLSHIYGDYRQDNNLDG